jgi:hypothetical protein
MVDLGWMNPNNGTVPITGFKKQVKPGTIPAQPANELPQGVGPVSTDYAKALSELRPVWDTVQAGSQAAALEALKQGRQFAGGVAASPWNMASMATALPEIGRDYVSKKAGFDPLKLLGVPSFNGLTMELAKKAEETAATVTGEQNPENFMQGFMKNAGGAVTPVPGEPLVSALLTTGQAIAPMIGQWLNGVNQKRAAKGEPALTPEMFSPVSLAHAQVALTGGIDPDGTTPIKTVGGPTEMGNDELATLGWLSAATLGMMFAPRVFTAMKFGQTPKFRSVENAAPGTLAASTYGDLARTYDDSAAGAIRLAKRIGVNDVTLDNLSNQFSISTRTAARTLGDTAVQYGIAETPKHNYRAPVSISDLSKTDSPDVRQYLHLRHAYDEYMATQRAATTPGAKPTNMRLQVYGLTGNDILRQINALEASNPQLREIGRSYRQNTFAARKFASTGQYSIMTKKQAADLNATKPNDVHQKNNLDDALPTTNPFESSANVIHTTIRERLDNDARASYIDAVRAVQPDLFKPVTAQQIKDNPQWKGKVTKIYRRGRPEYYTSEGFLADVLKLDPSYNTTNAHLVAQGLKRGFEATTTGFLAPWFSVTSALRNYGTGKVTMPLGQSPTIVGSLLAIPQQLIPQAARAVAVSLDRGSGSWLRNVFGDPYIDAVSQRLARTFNNSWFAQMEAQGTNHNTWLTQGRTAYDRLISASKDQAPGPVKAALEGFVNLLGASYKNTLNSIHNAPQFAMTKRNQGKYTPAELANMGRDMAGDPRISGQYKTETDTGIRYPIRLEGKNKVATKAVQTYGSAMDALRNWAPWTNVVQQSAKRILSAYVENPAAFTGKVWLYNMLPAAATYVWNASLGPEYTDYMMNRRSGYNKAMNFYVAIPGKKPEEGIELPLVPQELTIFKHMMEVALDHATRSAQNPAMMDFQKALESWLGVTIVPAMPPPGAALLAQYGQVPPMSLLGGEAYSPNHEPYDTRGNQLPTSLDLTARALGGGLADVVLSGYGAFVANDGNYWDKLTSGLKEAGTRAVQKTPILRSAIGVTPLVSSTTDNSNELFAKQDAIDKLTGFFSEWDRAGGLINVKPPSAFGGQAADAILDDTGKLPQTEPGSNKSAPPGLNMPPPTNPLYKAFILRLYNDFETDNSRDVPGVTKDMIGFKSIWARRGDLTKAINSIKPVNAGNYVTWQKQLASHPEWLAELTKAGVSTKNPIEVRNYLVKQRQDVDQVLLMAIRKTEQAVSQEVGRPIRLEDLDPYGHP